MGDINFTVLAMLLHVWYPNDDIAYLYFSGKRIHDATADWFLSYATFLFGVLALALLIQRGMRLTTVTLFGRILGLRHNLLFQRYEEEAFSPWRFLLCGAVVLSISYVLAWHFIPPYCVVFRHTQTTYFAATVWNVLIGSVLVDSLGNLVALLLIRCGIDPARILWDNVGVAVGAVALLRFFQNSWFTIGTSVWPWACCKACCSRLSPGGSATRECDRSSPATSRFQHWRQRPSCRFPTVLARSPDRATRPDRRSPDYRGNRSPGNLKRSCGNGTGREAVRSRETCGRVKWRGQETIGLITSRWV